MMRLGIRVGLSVCAASLLHVCAAQNSVSFNTATTSSGVPPANIYAVDVNNDGVTDIIQDMGQGPSGFAVLLGNGDGTYKAPVVYSVPGGKLGFFQLATADVNNDGKVDVIAAASGTNVIETFLGNGDGTFQAPKSSAIAISSGYMFGEAGIAAADFNADGKLDVALYVTNYSGSVPQATQLYVVQGDGAGNFSNPHMILAGGPLFPEFLLFAGDFDADGKTDLATTQPVENSEGNTDTTPVHVLYGNNDFTFTDTVPYTANGNLTLTAGDLNSDGITDLFGDNGSNFAIFYGQTSRTFSTYFPSLQLAYATYNGSEPVGWRWTAEYAMADFNGDGRMDLAVFHWNNSASPASDYVRLYLAGTSTGQFAVQDVPLSYYSNSTGPVPALFGNLLTPGVVVNQTNNYGNPPGNVPGYLVSLVNQASSGYFGPCAYPRAGRGFNVCSAGTPSNGKALFSASANSFGQLRKIELWVDGKKVSEQHHTWDQHGYFQWSSSFSNGTHQATFYAGDVDNHLQRYDFSFTVGNSGSCAAPSSYGINVCSPANNSTASSPVAATATAKISGTLARMEIWVDGAKKYTETTSLTENTSMALGTGKHRFDFYAVNTAGTKWETTVYASVP